MLKVYHGSPLVVSAPEVRYSRTHLDFGSGFYVTPIREQALSWALRALRRGKHAFPNSYSFNDNALSSPGIRVRYFHEYNQEWLQFIMENRRGQSRSEYDLICGGVANDNVFNTLELYFAELIPEEEALKRLKYEKTNQQFCFRTQEMIDRLLIFDSVEEVFDGSK